MSLLLSATRTTMCGFDGETSRGVTEGAQGWLKIRKLQAGDSIGSAINLSKIIGSVCKVIEVSRYGSGRCGDR